MELRHLRYFVGIVDAGSLTKASKQLHVAQPALSVHLANLEVELGLRLVVRSNRGIELTEDGALLYERAVVMLRYHDEALSTLKTRHESPKGTVSIGMPSNLPGLIAAPLYALCRKELPEVSLYLADTSSAVVYEWLLAGKLDLAVLYNLPDDGAVSQTPLFWDDFCIVGAERWGVTSADISFAEVLSYPLAMPSRSTSWRKILDDAAEKRGLQLNSPFETESFSALRALALSGECCAVLPRSCLQDDIVAGTLHARRIVDPSLGGMYSVASINRRELSRAARAVREILVRVCAPLRQAGEAEVGAVTAAAAAADTMRVAPTNLFPINRARRRRPTAS